MNCSFTWIFGNITHKCSGEHCTYIDRKCKTGLCEKIREYRTESYCKYKLKYCGCIHICMTLVLFFIFDQKAVILSRNIVHKFSFLNKTLSNRTTHKTSCYKSKSSGCRTDSRCSLYVEILKNRTKCTGSTVTADHRYRTGTHTYKRV